MKFELKSTGFQEGERIPKKFSCEGEDRSPALSWANPPAGTKSFALICEDPDAPAGTWFHWGVYNIPAQVLALQEGENLSKKDGVKEVMNDFKRTNYGGPCPPVGHGTHHYHFRLLALKTEKLDLPKDLHTKNLYEKIKPHVLSEARLMGTYSR